MSGYRSLHREKVGDFPLWHVVSSPLLTTKSSMGFGAKASTPPWRIWAACGDGFVRGFLVREKSLETEPNALDASAATCTCTHVLLGQSQTHGNDQRRYLGCSHIQLVRNYVGDDDRAGDILLAAIDLTGRIRIWSLPEAMDEEEGAINKEASKDVKPQQRIADIEFVVENATGTSFQICPPRISGVGDVLLAVARLDGTMAVVATGLATPNAPKPPLAAGTMVDSWSKLGSIAMSSDWHPSKRSVVVGRQDGLVEILGEAPHRLIFHQAPVRAVRFTPDAALLLTASDDGTLAMWDLGRSVPVLVNHLVDAHSSWILSMTPLTDARRFVTCGADRQVHVWRVGQVHQALHTFTCDDTVWTIHATIPQQRTVVTTTTGSGAIPPRLISGSENGYLQIYSLEL